MFATFDDFAWRKWWEIFEPQARCFGFSVPVLPWLYYLVRLADSGTYDADRIFKCDMMDWRIQQQAHEVQGFGLLALLGREPTRPADCEMRARRVCHHDVPSFVQDVAHVALIVLAWIVAWQQIARPRIPPMTGKCVTDDSAIFARHENATKICGLDHGIHCRHTLTGCHPRASRAWA